MFTTLNILSRDQGKLFPEDKTEDEYYARFADKDHFALPKAGIAAKARWFVRLFAWLGHRARPVH